MGLASATAVIAVTHDPYSIVAAGLAGAALAAAVRGLAGDAPASLVAAVLAPLLVLASFAEQGSIHIAPLAAIAAVAWTAVELSRTTTSPLVAMLPASIAAVLDPAAVTLIAIAGVRLVTAPWDRPKWAPAVPLVGILAVFVAVLAAHGTFPALATRWFGASHAIGAPALARMTGEALGPLTAVAAVAGIVTIARPQLAEIAVLACAIGGLLVDARAGVTGGTTLGIAGLAAALAIGRFASTIRMPSLQAIAGATAAMIVLMPPALTVISR